jgi:predicted dinucleotide-binding enzyme
LKVGVLGTGDVGRAIANGFIATGHEVRMGARDAGNAKAAEWAKQAGAMGSTGTFAAAARFGDVVVLATLGAANLDVLRTIGDAVDGKVLIDTTNPLDFSKGAPPTLFVSGNDSGGEQVQRAVPRAKVVKAFNTIGHAFMFRPGFPGGQPTVFIAGDDAAAKKQVSEILEDFGLEPTDIGGIECSRYLEAMCMVWVLYGFKTGTWTHAFKLIRK